MNARRQLVAARFWAGNSSGSVGIAFGLACVMLAGTAALAVDGGRAYSARAKLQANLDSAVLAGVSYSPSAEAMSGVIGGPTNDVKIEHAQKMFAHQQAKSGLVADQVSFEFVGEQLKGLAQMSVSTTLARVLGHAATNISVQSTGTSEPFRAPACVMAMHPTRKHTLELSDSVSVVGPDCHIYGNSDHFDDVVDPHTPENFLVGKSVQAVGFGHHYLENVTPPLEHAPEVIPDPLAPMIIPVAGSCTYTNVILTGGTHELNPGNYCGGLRIEGGANVTLKPGIYVIAGGRFTISGAQLTGTDAAIALADAATTIEWTSSVVRLGGRKTGTYAGIVVMGARIEANHSFDESTVDLHGVFYVPNGSFTWKNIGTPTILAKWTSWIVDGFSWTGSGTVKINFNIKDSDVPYPNSLRVIPRPGTPRLVN